MRGQVHHIDLTVRDPKAALVFYEPFLGYLGYRLKDTHDRGYDFDLGSGQAFSSIGLVKATGDNAKRGHDRYSPGLHHLAFRAASRGDVDALHSKLSAAGATVLDPPADYPKYGQGYYAVFFADPDGLKLEFVFTP
jgi:catechol 2,3-dioxygenase-like lactoylglutathione lyase family enzyme